MPASTRPRLRDDVATILDSLTLAAAATARPSLVVCVGLPGTGKSTFARRLAAETGAIVLESDVLRRRLVDSPTFSASESVRLFRALHEAAQRLLQRRYSVIFDATSLRERDRTPLYEIAAATGANLIVLRFDAPEAVVEARLEARDARDASSADMAVYNQLRHFEEELLHEHLLVDTSDSVATESTLRGVVGRMGGTP
ncbi:MAG TPA: ATP-binding protein [Dehalococcoidia bacterium]|nr:ATP-binding protein [Dehalococcoidia bacterium]